MLSDTFVDEPVAKLILCPRCGLDLEDEDRAAMPYCAVCRRGDIDAGGGVPERVAREKCRSLSGGREN